MRKIIAIMVAGICLLASGCNTGTTELGYDRAKSGDYIISYVYHADSQVLKKAVAYALSKRGWNAAPTSDGYDASISHGGVYAKAKIRITNEYVSFDTRGSKADGEAVVPYRYIEFLNKSISQYIKGGISR